MMEEITRVFVPIDRKSIKSNPKAGEWVNRIPTHITYRGIFTTIGKVPEWFAEYPFIRLVSWSYDGTRKNEFFINGPLSPRDIERINAVAVGGITLETKHNFVFVEPYKEPDYLYNYDYPVVACEECGKVSSFDKFYEDCGYDTPIYNICPNCNHANDFEVVYERIEDVVSNA